ncbi:MAG: GNAT family N-acetyltransferase [Anaerolineae bacterium]|nr:GNAT family N-acetyltransferase [Anaerolineae bacterium]
MTPAHDLFRGRLVRLAAPLEADAPHFARWVRDAEYLRALDTDYVRPMSVEEMAQRLASFIRDPGTVEFRIRTLHDDTLIGFVALHTISWHNRSANLAIGIGEPDYRGRGYGTDALRVVLRVAFHEMHLERVGLNVNGDNTRAIRAYEKAGFHHEGTLHRALLRDGRWQDRIIMGAINTNYDPVREEA